ncbi:MAG: virulence factor BrkB family protein [Gammaproteobacteria bacterium]|nr:MAG: virulence factor BrkB family protein [Gammaproteobacteria bacterium]
MEKVFYLGRFLRFMLLRFIEDRGTQTAGTLAYTTLLSLVPLMAVGFSFLAIFSDLKGLSGDIEHFIFSNFMPTSGEVVKEYVGRFASKASQMSATGLVVLIITALMMMATIDASLNRIWRVRVRRNRKASFLVYGAVLTWGPILVGMGIALTSYLVSLPLITDATSPFGGKKTLLSLMPYILETVAFTLLYLLIPNRRVLFRHAISGGVLAAVLFEICKRGFAWYVTTFPTYEVIYGALATIPIFLVWVYVSWLVVLLGAEFACCLDVYRDHAEMSWHTEEVKFVLAVRLVGYLWRSQQRGKGLTVREMLKVMPTVDEENLRDVVEKLQSADFIVRTSSRRWILARDLDAVSMLDLYRIGSFALPEPSGIWLELDGWSQRLGELLIGIEGQIEKDMGITLKSFYMSAPGLEIVDETESNVMELYDEETNVAEDDTQQQITG